jgi:hypothetical protein
MSAILHVPSFRHHALKSRPEMKIDRRSAFGLIGAGAEASAALADIFSADY